MAVWPCVVIGVPVTETLHRKQTGGLFIILEQQQIM